MDAFPTPSILDLAYSVLVDFNRPLSAKEIAELARQAGYFVSPEEVQFELDCYIQERGFEAPILQIGRERYCLLEANSLPETDDFTDEPTTGSTPLSFYVIAGMGFFIAVFFVISLLTRIVPGQIAENPPVSVEIPLEGENIPQAEAPAPAAPIDLNWWNTNAINQMNMETQRIASKFLSNRYNTCGPAVLAMMANYYRSLIEGNTEKVTAGELIKAARNKLGYFYPPYNSGLLNFKGLRAIGGLVGLEQTYPQDGRALISIEDLLARVQAGEPAVVGMRYAYQGADKLYLPAGGSDNYNHFVILIAAFEDEGGLKLHVFNPHPGYSMTDDSQAVPSVMSLDEFVGSWALNDGSEYSNYGHAAFYRLNP